MALLAAHQVIHNQGAGQGLPKPSWQRRQKQTRPSFQQIIQCMRVELWAHDLGVDDFHRFETKHQSGTNATKFRTNVADAVLYACN